MSGLLLAAGVAAVFLGLAVFIVTVGTLATERQQVARSLAAVQSTQLLPESMRRELDQPFSERVVNPLLAGLTRLGRRYTAEGRVRRMQRQLDLAGNPARWDVDRILAFKMLGLLVGAVLGVGICLLAGVNVFILVLVAAGATVLGYFTPDLTLYQLGANRQDRMRKDLPDALDMLSISVEAGLGFDAALAQLAKNTRGPLADEFFRVLQEMQIGMGRMEAMRALGERTSLPELQGFVSAMVQADNFGIPIANVLRVQAAEMRIKRSQRAEEQAQKVPVKILFPLIFCILPSLFIVVIGPAAITIVHNILHR